MIYIFLAGTIIDILFALPLSAISLIITPASIVFPNLTSSTSIYLCLYELNTL